MTKASLIVSLAFLALVSAAQRSSATVPYEQAVLQDSPVGYWRFDDTIGTVTATNLGSEGSALNGTYIDVTLQQSSAFPGLGGAAAFDNPSSVVDLANNISTWLNQSTSLEFWIKTTQVGSGTWNAPAVAGADQNGNGNDLFWGTNSDGRIGVRRGDSGPAALTPNPINDDSWHYVVLTRDKPTGIMNAYLDGDSTPVATFDDVDNLDINTIYNQIGAVQTLPGSAQKLNATLDEVAIYDYVLSGAQIHSHYVAVVPEPGAYVLMFFGSTILLGVSRNR